MNTPHKLIPSLKTRLFYGVGAFAYGIKNGGFSYFLLFFYSQVLNLPATLAGIAILIALLFDSITDPLIGVLSDNLKTRWGRRHPFMYASAIPTAVAYYLLWNPPELSQSGLFWYLTITAILVRVCITLYEIPSSALVAELTDDYDERTRLLSFRYMFGWFGGLTFAILNWGFIIAYYGLGSAKTFNTFGTLGAIGIFLAIIISSIGLHQYIPYLKQPIESLFDNGLSKTFAGLKKALSNRNFSALFFAGLFSAIGTGVAASFDTYIIAYFWEFTSEMWRWVLSSLFISALIPLFLAPYITAKWDKKRGAMGVYSFQIVFAALPFTLRLLGWFPENDNPWTYYLIWGHSVIYIAMIVMFGIIQSSMLADVVEHSQMKTNRRDEGLFFAFRSLAEKATQGIGILLAGIALDIIEFPRDSEPGMVPDDTIWNLGLIYGPMLMILYFLALYSIAFYRISRDGHEGRIKSLQNQS